MCFLTTTFRNAPPPPPPLYFLTSPLAKKMFGVRCTLNFACYNTSDFVSRDDFDGASYFGSVINKNYWFYNPRCVPCNEKTISNTKQALSIFYWTLSLRNVLTTCLKLGLISASTFLYKKKKIKKVLISATRKK